MCAGIASAPDRKLTLSGIYAFIAKNYPYYKWSEKGWQNSIRHNLSLSRQFVRIAKPNEPSNKGSHWRLLPEQEEAVITQVCITLRTVAQNSVTCIHLQAFTRRARGSSAKAIKLEDDTGGLSRAPSTASLHSHNSVTPPAILHKNGNGNGTFCGTLSTVAWMQEKYP